ncbi:hypothetical protein [Polaromonas sp. YR568]|uniref:hypothetical protein n=1 Tax=Polaromonas sp. YR568 TaxID=1855301 RepID=UPI0031378B55
MLMSSRVTAMPALPAVLCLLLAVGGCSPAFNWREVRPDATRLALLLPCKPDKAQKQVPLGGQATTLSMQGCDAGDATFAVAVATLPNAAGAAEVLTQWQAATLANMKAAPGSSRTTVLRVSGVNAPAQAVLVSAQGKRPDGATVQGQAAYFADGAQVFQVVMYADKVNAEAAETFFSSLRFE